MSDHIDDIIAERGHHYGSPLDHFATTAALHERWRDHFAALAPATGSEAQRLHAVSHAAYMILDKLVRAAHDPYHADNWHDIQGYARCAMDALGIAGGQQP